MPLEALGDHVMLVYVDVYGNEYTEVRRPSDFLPERVETATIAEAIDA